MILLFLWLIGWVMTGSYMVYDDHKNEDVVLRASVAETIAVFFALIIPWPYFWFKFFQDRFAEPDQTIGQNYLERWRIIPRNNWFNIYLHKYTGSDNGDAPHDHMYFSVSYLLKGELLEHCLNKKRIIPRFFPVFRSAKGLHWLELIKGPAWTLFITGPRYRDWGFYVEGEGWVHWKEYEKRTKRTLA